MTQIPTALDCTQCGKKEAVNFITSIVDGVTTQLNLCHDCFASYQAATSLDLPKLEGATCDYCGSPSVGASMNNPWERAATGHAYHYSCLRCANLKLEELKASIAKRASDGLDIPNAEGMIAFFRELDDRVRRRLQQING